MPRIEDRRITVLVPAYNESERVGEVLKVALSTPWVNQVVLIDDGSSDETAAIAERLGASALRLSENKGKGAALQAGIEATLPTTDIYLFLDADLLGLTKIHLRQLVRPLLYNEDVVMTVGKFAGGRLSTNLSQFVLPILNGQRALRAAFVSELPDLGAYRYGVEVLLSKIAESRGRAVKEVRLKGLAQVLKEEKQGVVRGTVQRYKMYYECLDAWRAHVREERRKEKLRRAGRGQV